MKLSTWGPVLLLAALCAQPGLARDLWVPAHERTLAVSVPADFGRLSSATLVILPATNGWIDLTLEVELLQAGRPAQVRRAESQRVFATAGEPLEVDMAPLLPAALTAGRDYLHLRFDAPARALGFRLQYDLRSEQRGLTPELHGAKGQPFDELRDSIAGLAGRLDDEVKRLDGILIGLSEELNEQVGRLDGILIGLSEELQGEIARLDGILIGLSEELNALDGKIALNKGDIEKNKSDILDGKSKFDLLKHDFDTKKSEYDQKISKLENDTTGVDSKIDLTKNDLKNELASKLLLDSKLLFAKDELKQQLASKEELQKQKDDAIKKEFDEADHALEQHKKTLLALKQSLLLEKDLADTIEKKAALQKILDDIEAEQALVDEKLQLSNLELQNLLQKQSQVFSTLSNIMKAQHDTMKAIINNLRG